MIGGYLPFFFCLPRPCPRWLEVPDSLLLLKQFPQPTSKLQWSCVQEADPFLPGSVHYLIIMYLLMSRSRKLVHDSDDASTAQKDVSSLHSLNTDLFLHQSFTKNLQLLQSCHLGCLFWDALTACYLSAHLIRNSEIQRWQDQRERFSLLQR